MKTTTSSQLTKTLKSGPEAAQLHNEAFVKGLPYENINFLAKTLKSGREAAKFLNKEFINGLPYENKDFQAADQNFEIWP